MRDSKLKRAYIPIFGLTQSNVTLSKSLAFVSLYFSNFSNREVKDRNCFNELIL